MILSFIRVDPYIWTKYYYDFLGIKLMCNYITMTTERMVYFLEAVFSDRVSSDPGSMDPARGLI